MIPKHPSMPTVKTIPVFYNTSDPYIIPVLSSQVEMFYQPTDLIVVSVTEEMCMKLKLHSSRSTTLASGRASTQPKTSLSLQQSTPTPPPLIHAKVVAFSMPNGSRSASKRPESPRDEHGYQPPARVSGVGATRVWVRVGGGLGLVPVGHPHQ